MKIFLHGFIFLLFTLPSFGQASNTWSVRFSDAIISRWPLAGGGINTMTNKGWEYSNSIMMHGMEKVYDNVPTPAYLTYIQSYIDGYVNGSGVISASLVSLDRIHPGITCLFLYEKTGLLKYRTAATALRNILVGPSITYSKTSNGIFWHKLSGYDNIVMLDGMYMAHPFLAKYGSMFGDNAAIDTAVNQTLFAYNQFYVSVTKLIKHAWKEPGSSGTVSWDDAAGNSTSVWSRAMGWYMMALVDILKYTPAAHPKRAQLLAALSNLAIGIRNYQDPVSHLWYQVVNKTDVTLTNNFLETSGSAMFVYALKTAVDSGWINSATYLPVAQNGWTGLQTKINNYSDSKPRILDFAPAMSVQVDEASYVQASLQPVDCPAATHPHGYAAILMAASVMEFPLVILPVKFISFTAKEFADNIRLSWENGEEGGVDHYEIQKASDGKNFITVDKMKLTGIRGYSWMDDFMANGTVYYRIKAVSIDGSFYYSGILPVKQNNPDQNVQVSPNPVRDGSVNILINNLEPGKYFIKLINSAGTIIAIKTFDMNDVSNVIQTVSLPASSSKGLYYVQLEGDDMKINRRVLIQ